MKRGIDFVLEQVAKARLVYELHKEDQQKFFRLYADGHDEVTLAWALLNLEPLLKAFSLYLRGWCCPKCGELLVSEEAVAMHEGGGPYR